MTIKENWDRMAELSRNHNRSKEDEMEFQYRVAVQNYFHAKGELPEGFIGVNK